VRRLVDGQFPEWRDREVRRVTNTGWNNIMFRLGDDMVVRLPRADAYADQVSREQEWLPKLAALLPLPIPAPLGAGVPDAGYPLRWSVYRWLPGSDATQEHYNENVLARELAEFLAAMAKINPADGPLPSQSNFFRGAPPAIYQSQVSAAIAFLNTSYDQREVEHIWSAGLDTHGAQQLVWFHGDISLANLLVTDGHLSAVIDFGNMGVGDRACDLAIAWNVFGTEGRDAFRAACGVDDGTWHRGRCWALWKALILFTGLVDGHPRDVARARTVLDEIIKDSRRS